MNDAESIGEILSLLGLPNEFGHGPPGDVENSVAYGLPAIAAFIEGDAESGDEPGGGFGPFGDFEPDLDSDILRGPW